MATTTLPTRTDQPHYDFEIDLDGSTYRLEFLWNGRSGTWHFDIFDANGDLLVAGRRVVVGFPLLTRFKDPRLPPGVLLAVDSSGQDAEAGLKDLGARVALIYVDLADWKAI